MTHSAYPQMVSESQRLGLPEHYHRDLTHWDPLCLKEQQPARFGWVLYDCGTHLLLPDRYGSVLRQVFTGMGCFTGKRHCYLFELGVLREATVEAMFDALEEWEAEDREKSASDRERRASDRKRSAA